MNSKRLFFALVLAIALLCAMLIGGAYFANSTLQKFSKTLVDKKANVESLETQQNSLAEAKIDIQKYHELALIAKSVVPQDKDQSKTVREIVKLANQNNIRLGSITFPSSSLGTTAAPSTGGTGSATPSVPSSNPSLSQLTPVKDISGVYSLEITVKSADNSPVPFSRFSSFLEDLERNRRTALVKSITITPDEENRSLIGFSLTLDQYVKPQK